jgi:5-methylcytosine-specific restriction endonuclease McrA
MKVGMKRRVVTWRTCTKCSRSLPISMFHSNGNNTKRPSCNRCDSKRSRAYHAKNRQKSLTAQAAYRARLGEAWKERHREWRLANPDYYERNLERMRHNGRVKAAARRARQRAVPNERIDPTIVFERSFGMCGICGKAVDVTDFHVDHIIPLALGGSHVYENVQAAHPVCNARKGARI